jgi:hypothetical protein
MREKLIKNLSICLFLLFSFFCASNFAYAEYSDDNGAFYYQQAFAMLPQYNQNDSNKLNSITSIESLKKQSGSIKSFALKSLLNMDFVKKLVKARKCNNCFFIPPVDETFFTRKPMSTKTILWPSRIINALGWQAIEQNRHKLGVNLFITNLMLAQAYAKNAPVLDKMYGCQSIEKLTLQSMLNYIEAVNNKAGKALIKKYCKTLSKPMLDLKKVIAEEKDRFSKLLAIYEQKPKYMAEFFFTSDPEADGSENLLPFQVPERVDSAMEYKASEYFDKDKKEALAYFDKMLSLDFSQSDPFATLPPEYDIMGPNRPKNTFLIKFMIDYEKLLENAVALNNLLQKLQQ